MNKYFSVISIAGKRKANNEVYENDVEVHEINDVSQNDEETGTF